MHVHIVDPSAYTPPYDHALSAALANAGAKVELITSRFGYSSVPEGDGYAVRELFYRHARGDPGSRRRTAARLLEHLPDMWRYRTVAERADVIHFQWLAVQAVDRYLLPARPTVLTAHDLLPREPRLGQAFAQRQCYHAVDAIVVHSRYGRRQLIDGLGIDAAKVRVIRHGAFEHLTVQPAEVPLPRELAAVRAPVVLFFGLLRPYKGVKTLFEAWRGVPDAELWVVGRPRMPLDPLRAAAPAGIRFVPRFVSDVELPAFFRRADIVVLPYTRTERLDWSGVLATALAFGKPIVVSDVGGLGEVAAEGAARLVAPGDADALHAALVRLLGDPQEREGLARGALSAAKGSYSWQASARETLALYRELVP
ncbi:MAG: glycosyltransferase family 4 protein [Solirubrobacterales bacterium]|nr:glycosyltransferase family 4 protein [Solirubrobacterales bacterium]MBV9337508.1 glycosyltransferase family 4 protein [Solirubrobacterales bacterium]MBV9943688.1 glycosyltransferase family 4 protein [Solirubrobacterales bacterium]